MAESFGVVVGWKLEDGAGSLDGRLVEAYGQISRCKKDAF